MPTRTPVRRAENAAYMRAYRAARPRLRERDDLQKRAHREASALLRDRHRDEFDALYAEAKARLGL